MKRLLDLFRRRDKSFIDDTDRSRIEKSEREIAQLRGDFKNLVQNVESNSHRLERRLDRLENVHRILQLRAGLKDATFDT